MKRSLKNKPYLPHPLYAVSTWNEDGSPDVMLLGWGGICSGNHIALNLENDHKTLENLRNQKAFVISVPDSRYLDALDYIGSVSAYYEPEKFENSGFHATPSAHVNAPVIDEFPLAIECEVESFQKDSYGDRVVGKIRNVLMDESLLDEEGNPDLSKLPFLYFDPIRQQYFSNQKPLGKAFETGLKRMNRWKKENRQD